MEHLEDSLTQEGQVVLANARLASPVTWTLEMLASAHSIVLLKLFGHEVAFNHCKFGNK